jgi:hypothetical protein
MAAINAGSRRSRLDYFLGGGTDMWQIWIGVFGVLIMAGGLGGLFYLIVKQNAVIGPRTIQFLAIVFVLPLLMVLGVSNVLGRETIGTIIGTVVGYVLSGVGRES